MLCRQKGCMLFLVLPGLMNYRAPCLHSLLLTSTEMSDGQLPACLLIMSHRSDFPMAATLETVTGLQSRDGTLHC